MYNAEVKVMLRPAILDVQGKTVEHALHSLGYGSAGHVRIGKHITLQIEADSHEEAERIAREVSARVLSNPVMEDFEVTVVEAEVSAEAGS
jgi:phosphoribosylformylglycinamidine synthase